MDNYIESFDGTKLYYFSEMNKDKETVIFVHGLTGSGSAFYPYVEGVTKLGFNVIIPDQRSHGLSENPAGRMSLADFVKDIEKIIDDNHLAKVHLVGHCFGALVALEFALNNPKKIKSLTLVSTPLGSDQNRKLKLLKPIIVLARSLTKKVSNKKLGQVDYKKLGKYSDWNMVRMFADWKYTSVGTLFELLNEISNYRVTRDKFTDKYPVFLAHGERDTVSPVKNSLILSDLFTNPKLLIAPKVHHVDIMLDPQKTVINQITNFLTEVK